MRRAILCILTTSLTTPVALAASADGQFRMVGAGAIACSQISADLAANPALQPEIVSWLQGYATATNRQIDDTWDLMGEGGIDGYFAAVQADCAANPNKAFEGAAFDVLNANYATRTVAKP
jgi:hypothetical protein